MALLLWSGGCDSTLLLYDMLTAKHDENGNRVGQYVTLKPTEKIRVLSIDHEQVGGNGCGKRARSALLPKLKRIGTFETEEVIVSGNGTSDYGARTSGGIIQPAIWLLHAALHLDTAEDLYAGYIRSDDVWHHREQIYGVFGWLQVMTEKTGRLLCPLEWTKKGEVIRELDRIGLLKHTWYCEQPNNHKPCGKCASCETHAMGLLWMKRHS